MKQPLISIIIPVYKVERFLKECLDSVITQTYKNLEIILIDDGSPDKSPAICDEYAKKDKRIKVIHQKNQGLSSARNKGIKISKGEFLSFVDSDDIIHPEYISYLYKSLNEICKASLCNFISFYDKKPDITLDKNDSTIINVSDLFSIKNSMCACGKLFHRSLFNDISFPLGKLHEDEFIIYKLFYKAEQITYTPSPLYYYRSRSGSIMHTQNEKFFLDFLEALTDNYTFFYEHNENKICELYLLRLTYLNTDYYHFCKEQELSKKHRTNISREIFNLPKLKSSFKNKIKIFLKTILINLKYFALDINCIKKI